MPSTKKKAGKSSGRQSKTVVSLRKRVEKVKESAKALLAAPDDPRYSGGIDENVQNGVSPSSGVGGYHGGHSGSNGAQTSAGIVTGTGLAIFFGGNAGNGVDGGE